MLGRMVAALRVPLAAALLFVLAACGRPVDSVDPVALALNRCVLDADMTATYRAAAAALAARAAAEPDDSERPWVVVYKGDDVETTSGLGPYSDGGGPPVDARTSDATAKVRARHGATLLRTLGPGRELVRSHPGSRGLAALATDPDVDYAYPLPRLEPLALPNDPLLDAQWSLLSFGAVEAWRLEAGAPHVRVAVIDTGVDLDHPDLAPRLDTGYDFYDRDFDPSTADRHGSHVAGIIAATGDNGVGVAGLAHGGVRIVPIKVFDDSGMIAADAALADAIRWAAGGDVAGVPAIEKPVDIINISLGTRFSYDLVPLFDDAIRFARSRGVLVVAASGNSSGGMGVTAPANSDCAVAVGSVDETMERSSFSNFDESRALIDLMAPGGLSRTAVPVFSTVPDGVYGYESGTSMASPFVAGAAALIASQRPDADAEAILETLLVSAYRPAEAPVVEYGAGVACPDAALGAATRCGRY